MTEMTERVERDEQEWATARLHYRLHGNWLSGDECATCLAPAPCRWLDEEECDRPAGPTGLCKLHADHRAKVAAIMGRPA